MSIICLILAVLAFLLAAFGSGSLLQHAPMLPIGLALFAASFLFGRWPFRGGPADPRY